MARDYHLWIATDLFGWTTVERRWGRIGTKGQGATLSFADRQQAEESRTNDPSKNAKALTTALESATARSNDCAAVSASACGSGCKA